MAEVRASEVDLRSPARSLRDVLTVIGPNGEADPSTRPPLELEEVVELYRGMVRTRLVDGRLERLQRQGRIGFHVGSLGEEAAVVGAAAAMREHDWLFPCYREFGALLWRGMPLQSYIDNMYGNADDVVQGRQMPDHYSGKPYRFGSVSSPIGTQISQAVGFAWAAKLKQQDITVGVFFGEGATSSNDFHAGMNFAGVFKTPTVFLCRNNRWAISVPSEQQTAAETFAAKGAAYGIPALRCDGNDALAVYAAVRSAVEQAARGEGPTMVELLTYRLGGHSTSDDPKAYRLQDEVESWRKVDPLVRLKQYLEQENVWDDERETQLTQSIERELRECIERAENKPRPSLETLFDRVYEQRPWHLHQQHQELEQGRRPESRH